MQLKLKQVLSVIPAVAALAAVSLLGACASHGDSRPPAQPVSAQAVGASQQAQAAAVSATWWRELGDEQLSRLIEQAIEGAPALKVAQARIARAQATVDDAVASFNPTTVASVDLNRQRFSANGLVPSTIAGKVRNIGTVQTSLAWEFDFFGRHRADLEAALGTQRAAQADAQAARALLASQVAQGYVQLARLVERRGLLGEWLEQREQALALASQRQRAGLDDAQPQRLAQAAVIEVRLQRASLDEAIGMGRNALAALTAQPPASLSRLAPRLPDGLRLAVPADVPADLLGRRADLVAARWRIEAATQDITAMRAQFYPNINLNALVGVSAIGLDRMFRSGSLQGAFGPAIRLPIFEAGRLRASLRGREADYDLAVESYNQALVDAVREVADRLGSLRAIAEQQREQAQAVTAAESLRTLAEERHRAGLGNRLAVLAAQGGVLAQRQQDIELQARLIDTQIVLIRALGGGYAGEAAR